MQALKNPFTFLLFKILSCHVAQEQIMCTDKTLIYKHFSYIANHYTWLLAGFQAFLYAH